MVCSKQKAAKISFLSPLYIMQDFVYNSTKILHFCIQKQMRARARICQNSPAMQVVNSFSFKPCLYCAEIKEFEDSIFPLNQYGKISLYCIKYKFLPFGKCVIKCLFCLTLKFDFFSIALGKRQIVF